ncbi:MAG: PAS domain S-box protein, partial [Chloroflexota bacterium]
MAPVRFRPEKCRPWHEADGSIGGIIIYTEVITERKQAEESLFQTRLFLESIIEHSPNSMWISDEHGTLIRLNQACRDHLHLKDDEVIGKYNIFKDNLLEEQGLMP